MLFETSPSDAFVVSFLLLRNPRRWARWYNARPISYGSAFCSTHFFRRKYGSRFFSSSVLYQFKKSFEVGYIFCFRHFSSSSIERGHILFLMRTFSVSYFLSFLLNFNLLVSLKPVLSAAFELSFPFSFFTPSGKMYTPQSSILPAVSSTIPQPIEFVPMSSPSVFIIFKILNKKMCLQKIAGNVILITEIKSQ